MCEWQQQPPKEKKLNVLIVNDIQVASLFSCVCMWSSHCEQDKLTRGYRQLPNKTVAFVIAQKYVTKCIKFWNTRTWRNNGSERYEKSVYMCAISQWNRLVLGKWMIEMCVCVCVKYVKNGVSTSWQYFFNRKMTYDKCRFFLSSVPFFF